MDFPKLSKAVETAKSLEQLLIAADNVQATVEAETVMLEREKQKIELKLKNLNNSAENLADLIELRKQDFE